MARRTSFYYAFLVLPSDQRRAIVSVWDFCRAVDDAVDESDSPEEATRRETEVPQERDRPTVDSRRKAVDFWRAELSRAYSVGPKTPQGRRLQPFIERYRLPREAFDDVIDGVAMDLDRTRYETFQDLQEYCRRVASAVGIICIKIFQCESERAKEYAENLGVALQLTNIIRDVKSDLARGHVYLPLEDFAAVGCAVEDLHEGRMSEPLRQLIAFECRRARDFYQRALEARPSEDRRRLVAAEIMRAVYFETLRRVERSGYDVFTVRARVPRPRRAMIALKQWLWQP